MKNCMIFTVFLCEKSILKPMASKDMDKSSIITQNQYFLKYELIKHFNQKWLKFLS